MGSAVLSASVVIPTRGRSELMARIVSTLMSEASTFEVVVAIDGNDPSSLDALSGLRDQLTNPQRLRWLVLEPSVGTARAKLAAAHEARGAVLVLLDDDVVPGPGLVEGHLAHHRERSRLLVVGSMPVDLSLCGSGVDDLARVTYQHHYEATVRRYAADPEEILRGLWGGNLSIRRDDYLELEPQLKRYPRLAHEDWHLGLVAHESGLVGVYDPALAGLHLHRRDWDGLLQEARRQGQGQRALAALHPSHAGEFDANLLPDRMNPLVAAVVRSTDHWAVRQVTLIGLHILATTSARLGANLTAERLTFAATQVTRRQGRNDMTVDAMLRAVGGPIR